MTILNVKLARAIWLVESRDLNPHGIDTWPIIVAIKDRYNFKAYPKSAEDADEFSSTGIVFTNGSFEAGNGRHAIVKATMFGDGIVVDSALSTDFCEAFLADALGFLASQFGLTYRPEMVHTRIYTSELIIQTEKDMDKLFAPLGSILRKLRLWTGHTFHPGGFGFAIDIGETTAKPAPFRFEREINKPHKLQRFYSAAPIRTSQHEELLRELEALL
jgi:hypothetical protein